LVNQVTTLPDASSRREFPEVRRGDHALRRPACRFTLRRLMGLVSVLALGFAILRHAVMAWGASEVMTIAPMVLLATNVLAWFQRARWQVFWIGFGLAGWAYLMLALGSPMEEHLPTTRMFDDLHDRLYPALAFPPLRDYLDDVDFTLAVHADRFRKAGHSVTSLVLALLGGTLAVILFSPRCEDREEPFPPDGSLLKAGWRSGVGNLYQRHGHLDRRGSWDMRRTTGFRIGTLMILIALVAVALAAWILVPPWWQYHQGIKLTG
jgi:hypothetical protein